MAAVVRDDDLRAGKAGDLGDVRVVDAAAENSLVLERPKEGLPGLLRELSNIEPRQDFLFDQPEGVLGSKPEFLGQPRGDGVELQAAVPGSRGSPDLSGRDRSHDPLRVFRGLSISMRPAPRTLVSKNAGVSAATGCGLPR